MAPKVTLTYFGVRARAELIRLILKAGEIEFEDKRISQQEWPEIKPTTPFLSLPLLCWDGHEVGQSTAIARFCAKKCGLAGRDDLEAATADSIVDQFVEVFGPMTGVIFASDSTSPVPPQAPNRTEANKKAKGDDFFGNKFPTFLKIVDKFLQKNGGKWLVGDCMSWADLAVFNLMDLAMDMEKYTDIPGNDMRSSVAKDFPGICELCKRIRSTPNIQKWLEERPKTPF